MIRFLHHVPGPAIALEALQGLFPKIPRRVLEELLRRYRRVWRRRYCAFGRHLIWHVVGAVWAMDFSKAPYLIDGVYCHIFSVRDLASGYQLVWQAVPSEKAEAVIPILLDLFARHGAPLVLKSDNGSAFIAEEMMAAMFAQRVVQLFSPAGRPRYNGALERSNTTNKLYTAQQAMDQGHPYRWSSADLEAACVLAGEITRPHGPKAPTCEQLWQQRASMTQERRQEFLDALVEARVKAAEELGLDVGAQLSHHDRSRLDRHAVSEVLQQQGYLSCRRGKRVTKKPGRVTQEDINKRAAKYGGDSSDPSVSQHSTVSDVLPPLPPLLGHRPCIDNARRASTSGAHRQESTTGATKHLSSTSVSQASASRSSPSLHSDHGACERRVSDTSTPRETWPTSPAQLQKRAALAERDGRGARGPHRSAHLAPEPAPRAIPTQGPPRASPREVSRKKALALSASRNTMHSCLTGRGDTLAVARDPPADVSARCERIFTSWWRSPITLLVSLAKAPKIRH